MFDFVDKHRRAVMIVLIIVIGLAFSLMGLPTFDFNSSGSGVAKVGKSKISKQEFDEALEQQRERMRQTMGPNFDPAVFDTLARRKEVLDQIIADRLLLDYAGRNYLNVLTPQIQETIRGFPGVLGEDGKISKDNLERLARSVGMNSEALIGAVRNGLMKQQLAGAIEQSAFISKSAAENFAQRRGESREVSQLLLSAAEFASQVEVKPEEIESYYKTHNEDFRTPEQVRVEYVVLTREAVGAQIAVSPDEVQRAYDAANGAKLKARDEARAKAEAILAQVRKDPSKFAELATQQSQDPGSAPQGGDLGFFGRGSMVTAFEDAAFKLKPHEISPLVETEFGFHIIQLTEIRKGAKGEERRASHILLKAPPVANEAASKAQIERELRAQEVAKKFGDTVENFKDVAYEQPNTLQPLADRFKLKIENSGWVSKTAGPPPIDHPRLIAALFAPDALQEKRNTEAVETAPGHWIVARVLEHKQTAVRPLAEVRGDIEHSLREERSTALARKTGEEKLQALQAGQNVEAKWSNPIQINREKADPSNREALNALFKADTTKLPAYVGLDMPRAGYALYRISKVEQAPKIDEQHLQSASYALEQLAGLQQRGAFVGALRERADVSVSEAKIEKKADE